MGEESSGLGCQTLLWLPAPAYGLPAGLHLQPTLGGQAEGSANDINDAGEIVGAGFRDTLFRAFLLAPALFEDGFESGDTSAWPQTVP